MADRGLFFIFSAFKNILDLKTNYLRCFNQKMLHYCVFSSEKAKTTLSKLEVALFPWQR